MNESRYRVEYALSRLIRYHGKRRNFFDKLHKMVLFANAVLGSSAFVSIITGYPSIAAWMTAILAAGSALDNVMSFSEKARLHQEIRVKLVDLYRESLIIKDDEYNEASFKEKRLLIERDAPPPKRVLDVICRNEEDIARGFDYIDTMHLHPLRRILANIIDLPPRRFVSVETFLAERAASKAKLISK